MNLKFESFEDALLGGFGREHLDETLRYISLSLGCSAVSLVIISKHGSQTVSSIGSKIITCRPPNACGTDGSAGSLTFPIVTEKAEALKALSVHFPMAAYSRNLIVEPVIELDRAHQLVLACASFTTSADLAAAATGVQHIVQILKSQVRLLAELAEAAASAAFVEPFRPTGVAEPTSPYFTTEPEQPEVISDFLLSTLIRRRSMRARRDLIYFGVRSWRSQLKNYQISALRALKRNPPLAFVRAVAAEVADDAVRLAGRQAFQAVTAVPCGHSGPNGFSQQLGRMVAQEMQISFEEVFAYKPVSGSSHPKTNISRPHMRMIKRPAGNTLLVDDVATSGAHIAEAGMLLRKVGTNVTPIAWIAA